jgi:hypothetical protein
MAARKQLFHPDEVRAKIQASQLINRLTDHALSVDGPLMDASQVNAAKILLGKAVPDLQAVTIAGDPENPLEMRVTVTDDQRAAALIAFLAKTKRD